MPCYNPIMNISISEDIQRSIQRHVQSGRFSTPEDVVRAAVKQLDDFEEAVAHIQEGIDDEAASRVHSLRDVDIEMRAKYDIPRTS